MISNIGSDSMGWENFGEKWKNGSLVLDREKGELVKGPSRVEKKGVLWEEKTLAALKSHSEAERRRRERINAHLATLRGLVPSTQKMDKATVLAEVIAQVKHLKKTSYEASKDLFIPMDVDEVRVEPINDEDENGTFSFMASLCCEYSSELLSDVRQALNSLSLNIAKAEISTLSNRVKYVFIFTIDREKNNAEENQLLVKSIHQVLSSIMDKISSQLEYSLRSTSFPNKRRRVSL